MSNEDKRKIINNNASQKSNKYSPSEESRPIAYAGPDQIVYEGADINLDGSGSAQENNQSLLYEWEQTAGPAIMLNNKNIENPSFRAPYVDFNINSNDSKPYITLTFQLVVKDKKTGAASLPSIVTIIVKMVQRALVMQGGGSLGAYEAGVFEALCEKLIEKDEAENKRNRPLFDIVAGTSIGAVNATIIVNSVLKHTRRNSSSDKASAWKASVEELKKFWNNISIPMWWFENPFFNDWWDLMHILSKQVIENYKSLFIKDNPLERLRDIFPWPFYFFWPDTYSPIATGESARRYFSWLQFPYLGWSSVLSPNFIQPDTKFLLGIYGIPPLFRFDNTPLARTIKEYWDYEKDKISTSFENGEPRLLLVSTDMLDATSAVTFDSYQTKTVYENGKFTPDHPQHIIGYPEGITIDHVKASMSPNLVYKYPKLQDSSEKEDFDISADEKKRYRYFWDGAYLSNTPLREVIHLHRYYWYDIKKELYVPHLELYIVNLYPTIEEEDEPPVDADTIQDREIDIRFHDRTKYDIQVANITSDYLILYGQIKNLALKHLSKYGKDEIDQFQKDIEKILDDKKAKSEKRSKAKGKERKYRDLIEGRFDLAKVISIERKDDGNTIFGKAAEFSTSTINNLRKDGYEEAKNKLKEADID